VGEGSEKGRKWIGWKKRVTPAFHSCVFLPSSLPSLLDSLTTFSTFPLDTVQLLQAGKLGPAISYVN